MSTVVDRVELERWKKYLRENLDVLCQKIMVTKRFAGCLFSRYVITADEEKELNKIHDEFEQSRKLLDLLAKRPKQRDVVINILETDDIHNESMADAAKILRAFKYPGLESTQPVDPEIAATPAAAASSATAQPLPVVPGSLKDKPDGVSDSQTQPSRPMALVPSGTHPLVSPGTDFSLPPEESEISDSDYTTDSSEFMDYLEESESEKALLSPRSKPMPLPEKRSFHTDAHFAPTVLHAEGPKYVAPKYLVRFASNSRTTSASMPSTTHAYVCLGNFAREIHFGSEEETTLKKNKITFNLVEHRCDKSLKEYFTKHQKLELQSLTLIGPLLYGEIREILKLVQNSIRYLHFIDVKTTLSLADRWKRPLDLSLASFKVSFNDSKNRLVRYKLNELLTPLLRFWQKENPTVFETLKGIRGKEDVVFEIVFNGIRVVRYTAGGQLTLSTNHGYKIKTRKVITNVSEHLTHLSCYYLQWRPLIFKFDGTSFMNIRYINLNCCKINSEGRDYEATFFLSFVNLETLILDGCKLGLNLNKFPQGNSSKLKYIVICNDVLTVPEDKESFLQLCSAPLQSIILCNCTLKNYPRYLSDLSPNKESLLIELIRGKINVRRFLWNYFPQKQPKNSGESEDEWARGVVRDKQHYFDLVKASDFSTSTTETIFANEKVASQIVDKRVKQNQPESGSAGDETLEVNYRESVVETCGDSPLLEMQSSSQLVQGLSGNDFKPARDIVSNVASNSNNQVSHYKIKNANVYYLCHPPSKRFAEVAEAAGFGLGDSPVGGATTDEIR